MEDKSNDLFLFWQVGRSGTSCNSIVTQQHIFAIDVDMSQAGRYHPARSAHSKFEAPSGGDFYPEEKRQNKAFLFGR